MLLSKMARRTGRFKLSELGLKCHFELRAALNFYYFMSYHKEQKK